MKEERVHIFDADDVIVPDHWFPLANKWLQMHGRPTFETRDVFDKFSFVGEMIPDPKEYAEFIRWFSNQNGYEGLKPMEGAVDGLRELKKDKRNRVLIATSCAWSDKHRGHIRQYGDKMNWLLDNLPFMKASEIIAISQKDVLKGYSMTDDRVKNLRGDFEKKHLFTAWHNKKIASDVLRDQNIKRVDNWQELMAELGQ